MKFKQIVSNNAKVNIDRDNIQLKKMANLNQLLFILLDNFLDIYDRLLIMNLLTKVSSICNQPTYDKRLGLIGLRGPWTRPYIAIR